MTKSGACIETRHGPRRFTAWSLCIALILGSSGNLRANSTAEEYSVKAAFLFHFAQFVEWPEAAFRETDSPLVYCTIGEDPFRGALNASLSGKRIGARALQVRHLKEAEDAQGCQVVFIGEREKKQIPAALARLKGNPVLTVGESERFAQDGGMIGFSLEENKIRFEINLESAEKAKLKISAKLLSLAKTVIGGTRGN